MGFLDFLNPTRFLDIADSFVPGFEERSRGIVPPPRSATSGVTTNDALSLASVYRSVSIIATAMKQFFAGASPVTVTASPTSVSGATAGFSSVTTNSVTATPTGGAAPYAYVWTLVTDDGGSWGTINPTSQTTAFTCGDVNDGDQFNATFRCTVTDALGSAGAVDVPANVINYGGIYP